MNHRQSGFSLIELIVVLTISSIIIGAVSMRWTSTFDKVTFETSVQRIIDFDNQTRRHSIVQKKPCRLKFDLQKDRISATRWSNGEPFEIIYELDEKVQLNRVNTIVSNANPQSLDIDVSPHGTSQTYYLQIQCANESRWVVIAGGSGQANEYENEHEVAEVLAAFKVAGVNTD